MSPLEARPVKLPTVQLEMLSSASKPPAADSVLSEDSFNPELAAVKLGTPFFSLGFLFFFLIVVDSVVFLEHLSAYSRRFSVFIFLLCDLFCVRPRFPSL